MSWPTKKLGEICEIVKGKKPKLYKEKEAGMLPYLGARFMRGSKEAEYAFVNDKNSVAVVEKDLIIICDGSKSGDLFSGFEGILSSTMGKIRFSEKEIERGYLKSFLDFNFSLFNDAKKGAAIPHLDFTLFKNLEILLPPIGEQRKIVAKLEKVLVKINEAKKLRAEVQENADNLLSAELHKIFEEGKKKGWEEKELGDVFVFNYGKGLSRLERSEAGKYIVYGANGELGRSNKYLVEGDGIIVGRKGSAGEVTRAAGKYWPTDVTYFVVEDKKYNIGFAYHLFKFLNFPQYAAGVKPGINRNQIYSIKILLPSFTEQKKIVARLDKLSEKIRQLQEYQKKTESDLVALEQAILHKAFSGKL